MPGTTWAGGESGLLHLGKVVFRIPVELEYAYLMERVLTVPPDFGDVKGVFIMLEGLLFGHNLNVHCPSGVFSALNGLVKIPAMALPVFGNEGFCFCIRQIF